MYGWIIVSLTVQRTAHWVTGDGKLPDEWLNGFISHGITKTLHVVLERLKTLFSCSTAI